MLHPIAWKHPSLKHRMRLGTTVLSPGRAEDQRRPVRLAPMQDAGEAESHGIRSCTPHKPELSDPGRSTLCCWHAEQKGDRLFISTFPALSVPPPLLSGHEAVNPKSFHCQLMSQSHRVMHLPKGHRGGRSGERHRM